MAPIASALKCVHAYSSAEGPYRFYFYRHEPNEPPHVQVDREDKSAKFWLRPVSLARNLDFVLWNSVGYNESWRSTKASSCRRGMGILALTAGERVADVSFSDDCLCVTLRDGRKISAPLAWYPRLFHASPEHLDNRKVAGGGYGIYGPDLDEDLSTAGLLRGAPAPRTPANA